MMMLIENGRGRRFSGLTAVVSALLLAVSCSSSYRSMTTDEKRDLLADLERETLAELVETYPDSQSEIDRSVGHAIISNRLAKVPFVGAGEGIGVVFDAESGERTYLKVGRLDVGGGLGVREYRLVVLFFDQEPLRKLAGGKLELGAGVEAGAKDKDIGTGAGGVAGSRDEKRVLYQLSDAGVSATFTVRAIRYSVLDLDN
jgi:lipid-binding SYLF domain-containing protein